MSESTNPEERKPIKRQNSRFQIEDDTDEKGQQVAQTMYRPEFGQDKNKANEKIWELMSSYIGSDKKSI